MGNSARATSEIRETLKLKRHRLGEHAARIVAARPADQRLDRKILGSLECDFPADLQRARGVKAKTVARQVGQLGVEFAGGTVNANRDLDLDALVPRVQQLIDRHNR